MQLFNWYDGNKVSISHDMITIFFYANHPLQGFRSHCSVRGYYSLLVATAGAEATTRTGRQHTHARTHTLNPQLNPLWLKQSIHLSGNMITMATRLIEQLLICSYLNISIMKQPGLSISQSNMITMATKM